MKVKGQKVIKTATFMSQITDSLRHQSHNLSFSTMIKTLSEKYNSNAQKQSPLEIFGPKKNKVNSLGFYATRDLVIYNGQCCETEEAARGWDWGNK